MRAGENRTFLFRGQQKGNADWVVGDLVQVSQKAPQIRDRKTGRAVCVREGTVGMYSFCDDSNLRPIFSGDIIRVLTPTETLYFVMTFGENQTDIGFHLQPLAVNRETNTIRASGRDLRPDPLFWVGRYFTTVVGNRWQGLTPEE